MGIGSSLGAFHEDEFAQIASPWMDNPEMTPDNNTISPNEVVPLLTKENSLKVIPILDTTTTTIPTYQKYKPRLNSFDPNQNDIMLKRPEGDNWYTTPAQAYSDLKSHFNLSSEQAREWILKHSDWSREFKEENISPKEDTEKLMNEFEML